MKKNTWIVVLSVFAVLAIMFTFIFSSFSWMYMKEYEDSRLAYCAISFMSSIVVAGLYNLQ